MKFMHQHLLQLERYTHAPKKLLLSNNQPWGGWFRICGSWWVRRRNNLPTR